ncbi:MAG: carboxypeptidase regulatory-like domain-containing protein [Planctomycetes bacterium]|nr:carboxypeptidase regulatory-like domain-containing protein [Planctomycetota bacterium]
MVRRSALLLVLLVLTLGVGLWAYCQDSRRTALPMVPLVPATPIAPLPTGPGSTLPTTDGAPAEASAPARAVAAAPDERPTSVLVTVLRSATGDAAAARLPAPDHEVWLELTAVGESGTQHAAVRTDAAGTAPWRVAGGAGREVVARCFGAAAVRGTLASGRVLQLTLQLPTRIIARGVVTDAAGRGVPAAELWLWPWTDPDGAPPAPRRVGQTGADGRFELPLPVGGRLGAVHGAHAPSPVQVLHAGTDPTADAPATTLQLVLGPAAAWLTGRVVDAELRPIHGAEVELRSGEAPPRGGSPAVVPRRTRTAADGSFAFDGLLPGPGTFAARAASHGSRRGSVALTAGANGGLQIVLPPACTVHGRVVDEGGATVAGCRVWSHALDAFDGAFAVSAADGTFRLEGLPPGPVRLFARDGSDLVAPPLARAAVGQVELRAGTVAVWQATLRAPAGAGLLRGQVVDTDGARLPGWRVRVRSGDAQEVGTTDSGGFFAVPLPAAGPVDVLVDPPGARAGTFALLVQNGVEPGPEPLRLVVDRRAPRGRIVGRVVDANGVGVPAGLVCWHHERRELARFRAEDDGALRLDAVPPGIVDLHVEHPGHGRASRLDLVVPVATDTGVGTIELAAAATLHGSVVGADGRAPTQVEVALLTKTGRVPGDYVGGSYRFDRAPPGRHVLQVQGDGVAAANFVVELEPGVERRQDLRLAAGVPRPIEVVVPKAAGRTVSLALRTPDTAHTWFATATAEPDGDHAVARFVAWMAPGSYEAIAWSGQQWQGRATVAFVWGDDRPARLTLVRQ